MLLLKSREAAAAACRVVNKFYSISLSSSAHYYSSSSSSALIDFSQEISAAVKQRGVGELNRVVALESTIISHGMPWPSNMEMALEVEQIIRKQGAIPATIALMNGRIKVGLTMDELERLAKPQSNHLNSAKIIKTSRRDFAQILSKPSLTGATTVSSTMIAAHLAGIKVFTTGGIGGVHREGEMTWDVSADLTELGRTPVAVVCAGAKLILDIGRTLEYLETQGVSVVSFSKSKDFPAFYFPKSGFQSPGNLETVEECARLIYANQEARLNSGMLFAVPIPEEHSPKIGFDAMEKAIQQAVLEAKSLHVSGKELTPFLLSKLKSLTGGDSLKSNIELVKNNALVGAKIAAAFYEMNNNSTGSQHPSPSTSPSSTASIPTSTSFKSFSSSVSSTRTASKRPMIIGGTVLDITAKINTTPNTEFLSTSNPGTVIQSLGGVGRNVAEACHRTGGNPLILSALGSDKPNITSSSSSSNHHILSSIVGIEAEFTSIGMDTSLLIKSNDFPTAIYNVVLAPNGDMHVAVADMRVHSEILPEHIEARIRQHFPSVVCIDGNLSQESTEMSLQVCRKFGIPLVFEPTSVQKSLKIVEAVMAKKTSTHDDRRGHFLAITPNYLELLAMAEKAARYSNPVPYVELIEDSNDQFSALPITSDLPKIKKAITTLLPKFSRIIVKLGSRGVVLVVPSSLKEPTSKSSNKFILRYLKPQNVIENCVSVTGAGDSMVGTIVSGLSQSPVTDSNKGNHVNIDKWTLLVEAGMRSSLLTIMSPRAVSDKITANVFAN